MKRHWKYSLASIFAAFAAAPAMAGDIDTLLQQREVPFVEFGAPLPAAPAAERSRVIHLEAQHSDDLRNVSERHTGTAAYAAARAARQSSGRAVPVHAYDTDPSAGTVYSETEPDKARLQRQKENAAVNQYALDHAAAISVSSNSSSKTADVRSIDSDAHRAAWKKSDAILVQSAGNNGNARMAFRGRMVPHAYNCSTGPGPREPQELSAFQFADTYIRAGAAKTGADGKPVASAYSSCSAADVILENPYERGLEYRYYLSAREAARKTGQTESALKPILVKMRGGEGANLDGAPITNIPGTSFTAPPLAGHIAGAQERCPALTPYDAVALAFVRATPVEKSEDGIPAHYAFNGVLPYDDTRTGFGYLDMTDYATAADKACALSERFRTAETSVEENAFREVQAAPGFRRYEIDVKDSATGFRLLAEMNMHRDSYQLYEAVIQSPGGATVRLYPGSTADYALMATNGFFGNDTKGTWAITVPENVIIEKLRLSFSAVKKGGLVDEIIKRFEP